MHSLDHGLEIQRELELALDDLHKCTLVHRSGLICPSSECNKRVDCITLILTILILFGDLASVIFFLFFFEGSGGVEQDGEVQDAYFLIEDLLVDLVLALISDLYAEV